MNINQLQLWTPSNETNIVHVKCKESVVTQHIALPCINTLERDHATRGMQVSRSTYPSQLILYNTTGYSIEHRSIDSS